MEKISSYPGGYPMTWHLKYKDGRHLTFPIWGLCQPVYARDFAQLDQCYQDGEKQTFAEQMEDIGLKGNGITSVITQRCIKELNEAPQ